MLFFAGFFHHTVVAYIGWITQILADTGLIILADFCTFVSIAEFAAAEARILRFFRTKVFVQAFIKVCAVIAGTRYAIDEYPVIPDLSRNCGR